jgi:hypothetical protein
LANSSASASETDTLTLENGTAPFWFAFVGSGPLLMLIWPQLPHVVHADEEAQLRSVAR